MCLNSQTLLNEESETEFWVSTAMRWQYQNLTQICQNLIAFSLQIYALGVALGIRSEWKEPNLSSLDHWSPQRYQNFIGIQVLVQEILHLKWWDIPPGVMEENPRWQCLTAGRWRTWKNAPPIWAQEHGLSNAPRKCVFLFWPEGWRKVKGRLSRKSETFLFSKKSIWDFIDF